MPVPVEVKKLDPSLDPLYVESHQKKFHIKRLRNGRIMVCNGINSIKVINPIQNWGGKKTRTSIRSSMCKMSSEKFSPRKVEKYQSYGL